MSEKIPSKAEAEVLIKEVREFDRPDMLKIPKKDTRLHYRWCKNTPEDIYEREAQGYHVANGEEVRACQLKPSVDGTARRGDLILMVEDWSSYEEKRRKRFLLAKRQEELMKTGSKRKVSASGGGKLWGFDETVRKD